MFGAVLNQLGQTVKHTAKQIVKIPGEMAEDAKQQIIGSEKQDSNSNLADKKILENKTGWESDEERVKFLRGLYGAPDKQLSNEKSSEDKSKPKNTTSANPLVRAQENKPSSEFQEQIEDKTPEEQKKLVELRNKLHQENYYDPTFNPQKKQEERPAEKVEKEKQQEMMDLQKKEEKKPAPLAVQREQNKAEMFRGAAG